MGDFTTQNPGAASEAADGALIEGLREAKFRGDAWDCFAGELARYGLPITSSWTASLRNFRKCNEGGLGCPGPPHNIPMLSEGKAIDMANEIIARALNKFRDTALRSQQGPPDGGTSLNVMFITQCILQFPNVYRHWQIEPKRLLTDDWYDGLKKELEFEEELEFMLAGPDGVPASLAVIREEIAHALEHYVKDPRVERALTLRKYFKHEITEMRGVTERALGWVLQHHWRTLRGRSGGLVGGGRG